MKTKAAILVELKKDLILDEIEIPKLDFGQVLIKLSASRICGSQIGEINGVKGEDRFLPHLLGHEGAGEVVELGANVTHVKAGDHVVLHWRPGRGIQSSLPKYDWNGRVVNAGFVTTFNEYAVVSENRLTVIPQDFSDDIACLFADTLTTGFGLINNDASVKIGESVVVIGVGGIGLGVILGAKLAGAHPIIAVDLYDHKLEKAKEYGATHTINTNTIDMTTAVEEILQGKADVVVDGTGSPAIIEKAYDLTSPVGRTVLFGVMPSDKKASIHTLSLHFGKVLTGSVGGQSQPHIEIPRYLKMIESGVFDPSGFVSHHGKLEDVNDLISKMCSGEVIHAIMKY